MGVVKKDALKTAMDLSLTRDPVELVYAQKLNKLYHKLQFGQLPVFGLAYWRHTAPYDRMQLLNYSKRWRVTVMFEYKNRADGERLFVPG